MWTFWASVIRLVSLSDRLSEPRLSATIASNRNGVADDGTLRRFQQTDGCEYRMPRPYSHVLSLQYQKLLNATLLFEERVMSYGLNRGAIKNRAILRRRESG